MTKQTDLSDELIKKAYNYLLALGKLTLDFSEVERAPRYTDGDRETDVEHSFHLALSAMELAPLLHPKLDIGLIAQFSLVHDLPEVYSGDVWTFNATDEELVDKKAAEAVALKRLMKELPPYTAQLLERYEEQVEPEARFVRFIDKLVPAIINMLNEDAISFKEDYGVTTAKELLAKRAGHIERLHKMFPEFSEFDALVIHVWAESAKRIFSDAEKA
jgi:5'-deoxynucleotidase YfbR-like HD superfamily hydrolase